MSPVRQFLARPARASRLAASLAACASLWGCLGNTGSSQLPPSGVATTSGDAMFSVSWNQQPGIDYWVFLSQNPILTATNYADLADGRALIDSNSPTTVCNQQTYLLGGAVSYTVLNGGQPTFITINARTGSAPGGPGSPLVSAAGRAAGDVWAGSAQVGGTVRAVGYAGLTPCGSYGRPPSGQFVAVGGGGAVFTATWIPVVAGLPAQPTTALAWTQIATPPGFSVNLNAVTGRYAGITALGTPVARYVAVGDAGGILSSSDGGAAVWTVGGTGVTNANLHAVTAGASGQFIAVGDTGTIIESSDGISWVTAGQGVTLENLHSVRCGVSACIAAGANGTIVGSSTLSSTWSALPSPGANNWTAVGYGDTNINADYLSVGNGLYNIDTWVLGDDQGNFAYSVNAGQSWTLGSIPGAGPIVAIEYTSRFLALDALGNVFASEDGRNWKPGQQTGVPQPVSMVGTGSGFLVSDSTGATAISF